MGRGGLFNPVVFVSLSIDGDVKAELPALTAAVLPAPRYLQPGQEVTERVRIDVGPAQTALMTSPFARLKLTCTATVDPLLDGDKLTPSLSSLTVKPATMDRPPLIAPDADPTGVNRALALIVRAMQQGSLTERIRAAWQLLSAARQVEDARKGALPGNLAKPVLLSMTKAMLASEDPLVRASMLEALQIVSLDDRIIGLTAPCLTDSDPLVRLRLVELLAGKRTSGCEKVTQMYADDPDELVKLIALVLSARR